MYKVGVLSGKFTPPHRGHLNAIINAATKCEKLYVVVSDSPELTKKLCNESKLPYMGLKLRMKWLSQELQGFDHIKVVGLDETGIEQYPYGWGKWSKRLTEVVSEEFDVLFGGEVEYKEYNDKYFPNIAYEMFDANRLKYPISATQIRNNPFKYWDYILGSARGFFSKKILIVGTESCGKTTMTKYLAKLYYTSWSEEVGRYYSTRHLGGNEDVFNIKDFERISWQQYEQDCEALRTTNKVCFFDTDALITQYYADMYIGETSKAIEMFIDPNRYDVILFFTPDVKWVADGFRWNNENDVRWDLHKKLVELYNQHGFKDKIIEVSGDYNERLNKCIEVVDSLLGI